MAQNGTPAIEDIKKQVEQLMSWEREELALSIVTPQEILQNCTADELEKWTGMYVSLEAPEEPDTVTVKDFDTSELIIELLHREESDLILESLRQEEIAEYLMDNFERFEDNPALCRMLLRFVVRDELKEHIKGWKRTAWQL